MSTIMRKLTSRKLWLAVAGFATGAALALGADASDIQAVAGAVLTIISTATYIITEGKIDAEGVKNAIIEVQEGIEVFEDESET